MCQSLYHPLATQPIEGIKIHLLKGVIIEIVSMLSENN